MRDRELLEQVQANKMIRGLEHLFTRTGCDLGLFRVERRRLRETSSMYINI